METSSVSSSGENGTGGVDTRSSGVVAREALMSITTHAHLPFWRDGAGKEVSLEGGICSSDAMLVKSSFMSNRRAPAVLFANQSLEEIAMMCLGLRETTITWERRSSRPRCEPVTWEGPRTRGPGYPMTSVNLYREKGWEVRTTNKNISKRG